MNTPEYQAYHSNPPRSSVELRILMDGGQWRAYEVPSFGLVTDPMPETLRIFSYRARHLGNVRYEVYCVETGEVVSRIN